LNLEEVLQLVEGELKAVEGEMDKNLFSQIRMIPTVSHHLISSGGKRFRPILLLLCARLCGYAGERAINLASTVEFIHTASLLHDDVVDRASVRRGMASANALWGNGASVLVGDFLFTKSFSVIVSDGDLRILDVIARATTRMSEGEVMQLVKMGDPKVNEEEYYFVITNKTAGLIAAACRVGGILGNASRDQEEALAEFGLNIGIAFQLMDDTLDYISSEETFGKTIGKDLNEGKITLPLIRALQVCSPVEKEKMTAIIQSAEREEQDLRFITEKVRHLAGAEYTLDRAKDFVEKAKAALSIFPTSREREALLFLADYAIKREK
jgi:octaprenyl-diphosphate synthase